MNPDSFAPTAPGNSEVEILVPLESLGTDMVLVHWVTDMITMDMNNNKKTLWNVSSGSTMHRGASKC